MEPPVDTSCFDSRDFLPPESVDLSALWSYQAVESSEPSPAQVDAVLESGEDSEGSPQQASSGAASEQEQQQFVQMVNELNVMVAATIPGSPLAAASSPSSPASGSSSSFEPDYMPPSRGKRNKQTAVKNAKKARKAKLVAASPNCVELTEDELLTWSSDDYTRHISAIAERRRLTDREEQIVKDQKRRIKNRESAHESRERRRAQLEQLQEEVAELKSDKAALAEENARLRDEVARLHGTVRQFDSIRTIWNNWTGRKGAPTPAFKAAGMCLLVVLFSFGLLFNHHSSVTGPRISLFDRSPSIEAKLLRNNLVHAAVGNPTGAAATESSQYSISARQRNLLWADNVTPSSHVEEIASKEIPAARSRSPLALDIMAKETRAEVEAMPSQPLVHGQDLAVGNKANLSADPYQRFVNSNVTFLMCTELGKTIPTAPEGQSFKGEPFIVAFLPEDPTRDIADQTHVVQLTCRLLDVTRAEVRHDVAPTLATPVVLSAVPNFS